MNVRNKAPSSQPSPRDSLPGSPIQMLSKVASIAVEELNSADDSDGGSDRSYTSSEDSEGKASELSTYGSVKAFSSKPAKKRPYSVVSRASNSPTTTELDSEIHDVDSTSVDDEEDDTMKKQAPAQDENPSKPRKKRRPVLTEEERRMKRVLANRKSARTSRERRKKLLAEKQAMVQKLLMDNKTLQQSNNDLHVELKELARCAQLITGSRVGRSLTHPTQLCYGRGVLASAAALSGMRDPLLPSQTALLRQDDGAFPGPVISSLPMRNLTSNARSELLASIPDDQLLQMVAESRVNRCDLSSHMALSSAPGSSDNLLPLQKVGNGASNFLRPGQPNGQSLLGGAHMALFQDQSLRRRSSSSLPPGIARNSVQDV